MPTKLSQSFVTKGAGDADPALAYKFWVEIKGIVEAEFRDCSGLRLERAVETVEEGGVNDRWTILPGRNKYANIILKCGVLRSDALWKWFQDGLYDGKVKRVNFSILLSGQEGEVVRRWNVKDAFPVKWEGPTLNVESSQVAVETLEIAHHGLTMGE